MLNSHIFRKKSTFYWQPTGHPEYSIDGVNMGNHQLNSRIVDCSLGTLVVLLFNQTSGLTNVNPLFCCEDIVLFSHQTSSMKHHLTETHKHKSEIHNIVLSLQSFFLLYRSQFRKTW